MVIPSILSLFMSPLTATSNDPNPVDPNAPVAAPAATEVEWYRNMLTSGLLVYAHDKNIEKAKKKPGYVLTAPVMFGDSPSVESAIQRQVYGLQSLVGAENFTKAFVMSLLNNAAVDAAAYLAGVDPNADQIPTLIAKYAAAFWVAVTPA